MSQPNSKMSYHVSAPAMCAARAIQQNFELVEKPGCRVRATLNNLAIMIDVATNIFRMEQVFDQFVRTVPWLDKDELGRRLEQLQEAVRAIELVRNRLPRYDAPAPDPMLIKQQREKIEYEITKQQRQEAALMVGRLATARTVAEEQEVLRQAGIVRRV